MTVHPAAPLAFSGSRLGWADLPRPVRARIAEMAGAEVISEASATNGFSPGYASLLELADGTEVFVKAVSPEQNPSSPGLARAEIRVAEHLPERVSAPELLWSDDDETWVLLGFSAVQGRTPETPWNPDELALVLEALTQLAHVGTPAPPALPDLADAVTELAEGWSLLRQDREALARAVEVAGTHGQWLTEHLDQLVEWAADAPRAARGSTLVHGDLRADNMMIDPAHQRVWLIDWPHACRDGVRWFDLLAMLPSVAMQGGGDPDAIFWAHPNARGAERSDVRAVLSAVTGYFVHAAVQPPPAGIVNLRAFQAAQGVTALEWLRRL